MLLSRISLRQLVLAGAVLGCTAQAPVAALEATPPPTSSAECPAPGTATHRFLSSAVVAVRAPHGELSLVVVANEATRERGLMCVMRVPAGKGMIFVFAPPEREQAFWMKNTLVSLDMVFVSATGLVNAVAADVPATPRGTPDSAVARRQGQGQFVIELGAGDAARAGIVAGTKLQLPALRAQE